tara:strand:+ start:45 stop:449 length:405 start_codon:yes stop_codon:yes gene_type:complete
MVKNQLFKSIPPDSVIDKVIQTFGLTSINDVNEFSKEDILENKTVEKLYALKSELEKYYLPCKARTYLNDITPKNSITILRQLLRIKNYGVKSKEKYIRSEKSIIYKIYCLNTLSNSDILQNNKNNQNYVIDFN